MDPGAATPEQLAIILSRTSWASSSIRLPWEAMGARGKDDDGVPSFQLLRGPPHHGPDLGVLLAVHRDVPPGYHHPAERPLQARQLEKLPFGQKAALLGPGRQ